MPPPRSAHTIPLKLEIARNDCLLDGVVRIDKQHEHEHTQGQDRLRHVVEIRDEGRREEQRRIQRHRHRKAHPENCRIVTLCGIGHLDDGGIETALNDNVANVHKHQHDSEHTKLVRCEQACHDNLDEQCDHRGATLFKQLPKEGADGTCFQILRSHPAYSSHILEDV